MWVHDIDVIDEEHPVERFSEEHNLPILSVGVRDLVVDSYHDVAK